MKAKELRIGNLVSDSNFEIEVVEIKQGIIEGKTMDRLEQTYSFNIENIEPILLTKEWLLKFGFELKDKVNMGFIKQINFPHMENYLYANSKFYTTALWDEKKQFEIFVMNQAKYVHQLQNLYFALTEEELKIKK